MYIGKMVKNELKSEKGCSGSPFSYVLRFHNLFLYISNFIDIFIVVQKIISCRLSENSRKHGVKVWDMVSLSQQNHNGGRRHGVHSRSGSESGNSTA